MAEVSKDKEGMCLNKKSLCGFLSVTLLSDGANKCDAMPVDRGTSALLRELNFSPLVQECFCYHDGRVCVAYFINTSHIPHIFMCVWTGSVADDVLDIL